MLKVINLHSLCSKIYKIFFSSGYRNEDEEDFQYKEKVKEAFMKVKKNYPFEGYMDTKLPKYIAISSIILNHIPLGSKILDIGCGSLDLTAILANLGYDITGVDDLRDSWHLLGKNRKRILDFASKMGINLIVKPFETAYLKDNYFDAVLLIDILEHSSHPRLLINRAISVLKAGGLLIIETPNAVALAKRILVAIGKSSYPNVRFIYFSVGDYRGHVKEYTSQELKWMLTVSRLTEIKIKFTNYQVYNISSRSIFYENQRLKKIIAKLYYLASSVYPRFRGTIIIYGKKPKNWRPLADIDAIKYLKECYPILSKYNLDNEPDNVFIRKLVHVHK